MINKITKDRLARLKAEYNRLARTSAGGVLPLLLEKEIPEMVYNSNAIENSSLSLDDTEKIIYENKTPKNADLREVYEAKNLANIYEFLKDKPDYIVDENNILRLHNMLISGINDYIAGRFRDIGKRVKIGGHIAPNSVVVPQMIADIIYNYNNDDESYFLDKIAKFHARFEYIHPFNDGNGRTGRILINIQLANLGYPPITIFARNRERDYYPPFREYQKSQKFDGFTKLFANLLSESLHKRLSYMKSYKIIKLADYAKTRGESTTKLLNAARQQTIPAFRERGSWMIGVDENGEIGE